MAFKTYAEYLVAKMTEEVKRAPQRNFPGRNERDPRLKPQPVAPIETKYVKWLSELSKDSIPVAGGKGANLAEMFNFKLPVPPAFVITAQAYSHFLQTSGIAQKIDSMIKEITIENTQQLETKAKEIQYIVEKAEMPDDMKQEIMEAYENLTVDKAALEEASNDVMKILRMTEPPFVAVRSSATTEDLKTASFAGQQETFLNIKGSSNLIESVKKCWASLFTARAIYYREKRGFKHETAFIAVVVQKMINSDKSGVMFTINPVTNNPNEIVIESVFGLGEGIVSGAIEPDTYVIDKATRMIKEKKIGHKKIIFMKSASGQTVKLQLPPFKVTSQVLTDLEVRNLANYGARIEEHYKNHQDIEFAIEAGQIYIVQTRPVTTSEKKIEKLEVSKAKILVEGFPASPGISEGKVKLIRNMSELSKIQQGDILVTVMTNPDMVVTMQKANGIVTDEGGMTAHAAIVSREMGIPCVVGTRNATEILKENQSVTVDGTNGKVYEGIIKAESQGKGIPEAKAEIKRSLEIEPITIKTKTKIKVITDLPSFAERAAKTNADGVGLVRIEGIIAEGGKHPFKFMQENNLQEYTSILNEGITKIARFWPNKFIWVRTSDIRSDEYKNLQGAPQKQEANPMLGMHGIRMSLAYPDILKAELKAVKQAVEEGYKIGIMLPQVISVEEVKKAKKICDEMGMLELPREKFQFGVMIETPAATEIIEDICRHVDFISIGSNDLTQYTLAIDRGNEQVQSLYDEMNPAVLREISQVIRACKKYNVESSICGQAGSRPEMAEFLVREGIESISTNADAAKKISEIVAKIEAELAKKEEQEENDPSEDAIDELVVNEISDGELGNIEPEDIEISDGDLAKLEAAPILDDKKVKII